MRWRCRKPWYGDPGGQDTYDFELRLGNFAVLGVALALLLGLGSLSGRQHRTGDVGDVGDDGEKRTLPIVAGGVEGVGDVAGVSGCLPSGGRAESQAGSRAGSRVAGIEGKRLLIEMSC